MAADLRRSRRRLAGNRESLTWSGWRTSRPSGCACCARACRTHRACSASWAIRRRCASPTAMPRCATAAGASPRTSGSVAATAVRPGSSCGATTAASSAGVACTAIRSTDAGESRSATTSTRAPGALGYATELVAACTAIADRDRHIPALVAFAHPGNHGSQRVLHKSDFRQERFVAEMNRFLFRRTPGGQGGRQDGAGAAT